MADIILKDLYGAKQVYENVTELNLLTTSGDTKWYIERPRDYFVLQNTDYEPSEEVVAIATAGVGPMLNGGEINLLMLVYPPVEGVSEHPVVGLGSIVDGVEAGYFYVYETLTADEFHAVTSSGAGYTGTAEPGWNIKETVDGVKTLRHIDDPESVIITIPHPYTVVDEAAFYSYLSPVGQENKSVTLTENGTVEITPEPGSRGMRSVKVTVAVEGGGNIVENAITAADVTAMLASAGVIEPVAVEDNLLLMDSENDIYIL